MSAKKKTPVEDCLGKCYALKSGGPTMVCEGFEEYDDGRALLVLNRYEYPAGNCQGRFQTEEIDLHTLKEIVQ